MVERRWWANNPSENIFLEITRRDDIGADLHAPLVGRGGSTPGGYALVPLVAAGDIVVHYDSREGQIEGVSVALGDAEPKAVFWAARGRSAREAGVRPTWMPGLSVPLGGHRSLPVPIGFEELQKRRAEIFAIRDELQRDVGIGSLHFPWYEYGAPNGRLRAQQAYLVKLPRRVVDLFGDLAQTVSAVESAWREAGQGAVPEVAAAEEQVARSAGQSARRPRRRSLGQGFATDPRAKVLIEALAMNQATAHFAREWEVEDVHATESYDLVCRRGAVEVHVEVKGTTTEGASVLLTPGEVRHARAFAPSALFVLADVHVVRDAAGTAIAATGGRPITFCPWSIDDGSLEPIGYSYVVPPRGGE